MQTLAVSPQGLCISSSLPTGEVLEQGHGTMISLTPYLAFNVRRFQIELATFFDPVRPTEASHTCAFFKIWKTIIKWILPQRTSVTSFIFLRTFEPTSRHTAIQLYRMSSIRIFP